MASSALHRSQVPAPSRAQPCTAVRLVSLKSLITDQKLAHEQGRVG